MNIPTISTKQLREDFSQVLEAMQAGQSLLLLYRSQPLAEIRPINPPQTPRSFSQKQLQKWIKTDQLTSKQQQQINAIINRLP